MPWAECRLPCFLEQFQTIAGQEIAEDREFGLPI